jgi:hypothetical protein
VSSTVVRHRRLKLNAIDRMFDNLALVCCIRFHTNRRAMGQDPNSIVDRIPLVHDERPSQLPMAAALLWVCSPCERRYSFAAGLLLSPLRIHLFQEPARVLEDLLPTGRELEVIERKLIDHPPPQDHVRVESRWTREFRRVSACVL